MTVPLRVTNKIEPIADPDRLLVTSTLRKDLAKGWIRKMVGKVKESSTTQIWAAPVLLALVLGYSVWNGQQTNLKLDALNTSLIVLKTQKEELEKQIERERQEKFQLTREQETWRENIKNDMNEMKFRLQIPTRKREN